MPEADLWQLGLDTLDAVVAAYAAAGVDLPARQYVAAGVPVDDCEQLVVWLGRLFTGYPGNELQSNEAHGLGHARTLELHARIVRCVVTVDEFGDAPASEAIELSSRAIGVDMWVLPQGLIALRSTGDYTQLCQALVIGNCTAFDWAGGVGGVELDLQLQIDSAY